MIKPVKCPYCKGSGTGHDTHDQYDCWFCDGFGFVDEHTVPKVLTAQEIEDIIKRCMDE